MSLQQSTLKKDFGFYVTLIHKLIYVYRVSMSKIKKQVCDLARKGHGNGGNCAIVVDRSVARFIGQW